MSQNQSFVTEHFHLTPETVQAIRGLCTEGGIGADFEEKCREVVAAGLKAGESVAVFEEMQSRLDATAAQLSDVQAYNDELIAKVAELEGKLAAAAAPAVNADAAAPAA